MASENHSDALSDKPTAGQGSAGKADSAQLAAERTQRREALRAIDANANRAAEGLRTIEDIARLVREDEVSAVVIKQLRHRLAQVCDKLRRDERLQARSTESDAGTDCTAPAEQNRTDWDAVLAAAAERVTQSLRGLEEFSKLLSTDVATEFKHLRYAAYDVLATVELRLRQPPFLAQARLYLLIDCAKSLDEFTQYARELAEAGVDVFQLRDKQADGGRLVRYARAAQAALSSTQAKLIINDRADIAMASGAAGVHVGQEDMSLEAVRKIVPSGMWIGVSTHDIAQVRAAEQAGADYIGCGPTFASTTKAFAEFAGPLFLRQAIQATRLPCFAIGGIHRENLPQVLDAGCFRIAVSSAIHAADEPVEVARALARRLRSEG